jgi:hypothetical protein
MAVLFLQMFSSTVQKSHVHTHYQNVTFLWHWKTQVLWTEFCGTQGRNSLNPIKPGLCPENQDEWDPNVWHIFHSCTPKGVSSHNSVLLHNMDHKVAWYRWSMHVSTTYSLTVQKGTWCSKTYPIFVNCGLNLHDTSCCSHILHRYLTNCVL